MISERQAAFLVAMALMALCALPGRSSPDQFKWTGNAFNSNTNTANDNWNDENNWENISQEHPQRTWPQESGDDVTIDDTSPEDEVEQNQQDLTINSLMLSDGHTLNLTQGLQVGGEQGGTLECEGTVKLKGNGTLTVRMAFRVYADEDTTITFESGTGHLTVGGGV